MKDGEIYRASGCGCADCACLSQAALAAKVQTEGVLLEQDALSRIEKRQRMVQDYEPWALAEVLGVTSDWLLLTGEEKREVAYPTALYKPVGFVPSRLGMVLTNSMLFMVY